jgi:glycine oxidase
LSRPYDIIVIGAGVVGSAVAYELARRGASVQIVDDRQPGMGATQASAGMLAPFTEAKDRDAAFLDLAMRSLDLYDGFIERVVETSNMSVSYRRTGTIDVASTPERMAALQDIAKRLQARGVTLSLLDAEDARKKEPQLGHPVAGALLIPPHGYVNAVELTLALVAAARRHGANVIGGHVSSIAYRDRAVLVETARGQLSADVAVVAAGSWSGRIDITGASRVPVRPVRGQLLHLAWNGAPLQRVTWGDHCYLVPWDDGTLLVGATMEEVGFDERTTAEAVRRLLDAACELVPSVSNAAFLSARAGLRPGTPDALPVIGWSTAMPDVMYATGHFRNGVLLCPLTAKLVADAILDGNTDPALAATSPRRFGEV